MNKRHIITIAGDHASGQGSLSNTLQRDLNYEIYRNGQYARKLAKDMGMNIVEFQKYLDEHEELDRQIEKSASEYAKSHDNLIVDAKLGWFAIPDSFKVYLRVDIDVAAQRAFNDKNRKSTESFETVEEQKADMIRRYKMENDRYWKLYHVHKEDMSNYDLVIDTTKLTPEETANEIITKYNEWLKK